jgi:hypothetical protein
MPKINKTLDNPYGLSTKQKLVIEDVVETVKTGGKIDINKSHSKFYNASNPHSNNQITYQNLNRVDFRIALIEGLKKAKIIGNNSIVESKLIEGLDANGITKGGMSYIDFRTRLEYIKEINKISGVYAPEKIDKRQTNLNIDLTAEELEKAINKLQAELS